jgi:hypothetical protein
MPDASVHADLTNAYDSHREGIIKAQREERCRGSYAKHGANVGESSLRCEDTLRRTTPSSRGRHEWYIPARGASQKPSRDKTAAHIDRKKHHSQ